MTRFLAGRRPITPSPARRRLLRAGAGGLILATPIRTFAQPAPVPARVGFLSSEAPSQRTQETFRSGMREQGLTEGRQFSMQWGFAEGLPIVNRFAGKGQVPARTPLSDALSKDLKKRGFSFVGSTIIYAHMQAVGMVNDHTLDCFRHAEVAKKKR